MQHHFYRDSIKARTSCSLEVRDINKNMVTHETVEATCYLPTVTCKQWTACEKITKAKEKENNNKHRSQLTVLLCLQPGPGRSPGRRLLFLVSHVAFPASVRLLALVGAPGWSHMAWVSPGWAGAVKGKLVVHKPFPAITDYLKCYGEVSNFTFFLQLPQPPTWVSVH